jgi:two-component system sensor histidine kinase/response regulator
LEPFKKFQEKLRQNRQRYLGKYFAGSSQKNADKVLIVDDEKIHQLMLASKLKEFGLETDIANNGHEALSMCSEMHYDLIFMDIEMPGMDGIEATRLLNSINNHHPPVIGYTSLDTPEIKLSCQQAGMSIVIKKPADVNTLSETIAMILQSQ